MFLPLAQIFSSAGGLLVAYSAAVVLASVLGGMIPKWLKLTHTGMQVLISMVGGVMLGIAVFHMLPHATAQLGPNSIDQVAWGIMFGLLCTFFLLRFFHFHQHGPADFGPGETTGQTHLCSSELQATYNPAHDDLHADPPQPHSHAHRNHDHGHHAHQHDHAQHHTHGDDHTHAAHHHHHGLPHHESPRWLGVLLGLGLHTLMDGMALAASVKAEALHHAGHEHGTGLAGLGTFLAVCLHKPLDAISITSLMNHAPANQRLLVNLGFALMCPLGALLFWIGADLSGSAASLAGWGLAFSAGVFLCISLSDLLPEMEFHSHNRVQLTLALLIGIAIAWGIGLLEIAGAHRH